MSFQRRGRMVCFEDEAERFQLRAVGIARRKGHVLLHRVEVDEYWSLPGGRVEQAETTEETLAREMVEELGTRVEIGPLAFLLESFFTALGRRFHELGFYYAMTLPEDFPFTPGAICRSVVDEGQRLEFKWVPADEASLAAEGLRPEVLRPRLIRLPETVTHLFDREGKERLRVGEAAQG